MIVFKQFSDYPEIRWIAVAGLDAKEAHEGALDNPDLGDFKLIKFQQLRKQRGNSKDHNYTIILTGNDKTNIFINGPYTLLDDMLKRLPDYIGKSWAEINAIRIGEGS